MLPMFSDTKAESTFDRMCDRNTAAARVELEERDIFSYFLAADAIQPCGGVLRPAAGPQAFSFSFGPDGKPVLRGV